MQFTREESGGRGLFLEKVLTNPNRRPRAVREPEVTRTVVTSGLALGSVPWKGCAALRENPRGEPGRAREACWVADSHPAGPRVPETLQASLWMRGGVQRIPASGPPGWVPLTWGGGAGWGTGWPSVWQQRDAVDWPFTAAHKPAQRGVGGERASREMTSALAHPLVLADTGSWVLVKHHHNSSQGVL